MDVNRDNFFSILPEVLQDITDADYVAIDGEFTGILSFDKMSYFDTPAERYKRHYESDRHYLMIQIGLAMIRCFNPKENQYSLKAYNFYLYPENEMDAFDFRSKSSSLQFLAANHFDFTQLFLKGMYFIRICLHQIDFLFSFSGIPFTCKTTYLNKLKQQQQSSSHRTNNQQILNGNTMNKKSEGTTNNLTTNSEQQTNPSDAELLKRRTIGFSEVIWKLQESGKPVIGHNLYSDVLHMINQFFIPIPSSYNEYKSILKSLFPKLIDTKTIASTSIFQSIISNTALHAVYKTVREQNFPRCLFDAPANFTYALGEHEHTAGYDATCTAICMARMMAYIAEQTNFKENPIEHPLINSFIGKFFYMCSFDLRYSDMINDDDLPDRSGIFYVKHPQFWSTLNIREYFQRWGYPFCEQYDPTTHIVALSLQNETIDTLLTKMRALDTNLIIIPYAQFHHLDLSKIKIRQPNHLFDIDPTKRNSNKRTHTDAQNATPSSPMDIAIPTLESISSTVNPLQTAVGYNAASSTICQSSQKNIGPSSNEKKRPRV